MKMLKTILAFSAGLAMLAAGGLRAAPAPNASLDLPLEGSQTPPNWISTPSGDQFWREYPPLAAVMKVSGHAMIGCSVQVDGRLDNCSIIAERPLGMGFGAAALRMAPYFKMKPATLDGHPVVSEVRVPIDFHLPKTASPAEIEAPVDPAAQALARQVIDHEGVAARLRVDIDFSLRSLVTHSVVDGTAQQTQAWLDVYRPELNQAMGWELDRQARQLARHMSKAELEQTLAYLDSPAGKAWTAARQWSAEHPSDVSFYTRAAAAAKIKFCATHPCP